MTARDAAKQLGRSLMRWTVAACIALCVSASRTPGAPINAGLVIVALLVTLVAGFMVIDLAKNARAQLKHRRAMVAWQRQCDALTKGSI